MELFNITDPSDWPSTMPEMRTIDNLLRCGICQEFINIAMIIPDCSHNYCSQCIRRFMNYKSQCPACNTPAMEADIRNNKVLDELVKNFVKVRSHILNLCVEETNNSPVASETSLSTPQRTQSIHATPVCKKDVKRLKSSTKSRNVSSRTAKTAANDALSKAFDDFEDFEDDPRSKVTNASFTKGRQAKLSEHLNSSNEENVNPDMKGSNSDVEILEDETTKQNDKTPRENAEPTNPQSNGPQEGVETPVSATRSAKADCPVCGVPVPSRHINAHLDKCLTKSSEKETARRTPKRKPLPKLVYNLLSEKDLRKILKDYKLSSQGNKQILIRRLQEFTVLYNAQCDSSSPVPVEDIVKYYERMEKYKSHQPLLSKSSKSHKLKIEKGQSAEEIARLQNEYVKHHSSQFSDLIKNAKARMTKIKEKKSVDQTNPIMTAKEEESEEQRLPSLNSDLGLPLPQISLEEKSTQEEMIGQVSNQDRDDKHENGGDQERSKEDADSGKKDKPEKANGTQCDTKQAEGDSSPKFSEKNLLRDSGNTTGVDYQKIPVVDQTSDEESHLTTEDLLCVKPENAKYEEVSEYFVKTISESSHDEKKCSSSNLPESSKTNFNSMASQAGINRGGANVEEQKSVETNIGNPVEEFLRRKTDHATDEDGSISSSGNTEGSGCSLDLFDPGENEDMVTDSVKSVKTPNRNRLRRKKKMQLDCLEGGLEDNETVVRRASKRLKKSVD